MNETPAWLSSVLHWGEVIGRSPLFLSFLGAFVALRNGFLGKPDEVPRSERLSAALLCLVGGVFGGPALNDVWKIESENIKALIIIGCALFGAVFIKAVFQYARDTHFSEWPIIGKFFAPRVPGAPQPPKE